MRKTSELIWQDAQHQVLFEILDLIKTPEADRTVFFKLQDYTENHFTLEEHYMTVLHYPGRERHVAAHDMFRLELRQLLQAGEPDIRVREYVATFLIEWLKLHVFGIDKELETFILNGSAK